MSFISYIDLEEDVEALKKMVKDQDITGYFMVVLTKPDVSDESISQLIPQAYYHYLNSHNVLSLLSFVDLISLQFKNEMIEQSKDYSRVNVKPQTNDEVLSKLSIKKNKKNKLN